MNTTTQPLAYRSAFFGALVVLSALAGNAAAHAQSASTDQRAAVVWVNTWYGPNASGIGLAARYGPIGIGTTIFNFVGDTARNMPIRPGGVGISIDGYLVADLSNWLAMYGNIGVVARLGTHRGASEKVLREYRNRASMSLGGGFQVSLASHIVFGIGYNGALDFSAHSAEPEYNTIHAVVAQVGYRL